MQSRYMPWICVHSSYYQAQSILHLCQYIDINSSFSFQKENVKRYANSAFATFLYILNVAALFSLWSLRQIMVLTLKMGHFIQSIILQPYFLCQRCSHSFVPCVLCLNGTDYLHQLRNFTSKGSCITLPHWY